MHPATPTTFALQASDVSDSAARRELRAGTRRRMLKAGIIAFNNRQCTLSCTVRDHSQTGARLRVDGSLNVPDTFELIIESDALEAACQVVWRKEKEIGVRFLAPPVSVAHKRPQLALAHVPEQRPTLRRKSIA